MFYHRNVNLCNFYQQSDKSKKIWSTLSNACYPFSPLLVLSFKFKKLIFYLNFSSDFSYVFEQLCLCRTLKYWIVYTAKLMCICHMRCILIFVLYFFLVQFILLLLFFVRRHELQHIIGDMCFNECSIIIIIILLLL